MLDNKIELRKKFLALRQAITPEYEKKAQNIIDNKFFWFCREYHLNKVGLYVAKDKEVETREMIEYALDNDIDVYLPKVLENRQMEFYLIRDFDTDLIFNRTLGIWEPIVEKTMKLDNPTSIDAYFMPLICFDRDLNRIGFGQGYYDRYFHNVDYKGYKIGLARITQFSETLIQNEPYDVKLDLVITDKDVFIHPDEDKKFNFDVTFWKLGSDAF